MKNFVKKNILNSIYTVLLVTCVLAGTQQVYAWIGSQGAVAPAGNVPLPINVGSDMQIKDGSLGVGGLAVFGEAVFLGNVRIATGTPASGKVLTSDTSGNVSWMALPEVAVSKPCPLEYTVGRIGTSTMTCTAYSQQVVSYQCDSTTVYPPYEAPYGATGALYGSTCYIQYNFSWGNIIRSSAAGSYPGNPGSYSQTYTATPVYASVPSSSCPEGWMFNGSVCI